MDLKSVIGTTIGVILVETGAGTKGVEAAMITTENPENVGTGSVVIQETTTATAALDIEGIETGTE